ncbi:MAG: NnrU family protein [Alphaproteobacteria bacterium]|nr:NnrU family protein [Alphaproteobacteria bacterium]
MGGFAAALAGFVLLHIGLSATGARALVVQRLGEGPYRGLFALASAGLLAALIFTYPAAQASDAPPLYTPPAWGAHVTHALTLFGFLLGVTGLLTPGPTTAGFEGALAKADAARGVLRITRHPFLWGVALWAAGHLFSNGERHAVMLFAALGLMALFGTRSIDRKSAARNREQWETFNAATSNVPFAAIVQGRNRLVFAELWARMFAALAAYVAVAYFHAGLFRSLLPS